MSDSLFIQLGDQKRVSFPALAGTATLKNATGVELFYLLNGDWQQLRVGTTVQTPFSYDLLTIKAVLSGLHEVALEIRPDAAPETATTVKVAVARVAMAIDSNRDGSLDYGDPGRDNWVWERGHPGAVLIVNNDKDISDSKPAPGQRSEWSELAILPLELSQVPAGATLHLHATPDAARRFAVYEYASDNTYRRVLGRELDSEDYISQSPRCRSRVESILSKHASIRGPFLRDLSR